MVARLFVAGLLASTAVAAHAGETVRYEPAPAWVKPAPPIDAAKLDGDSPLLLVNDSQERLGDGEVWSYQELATRIASPDILAKAGTISIGWTPQKGDLVIHKLEIIRGAEHIDALAGGKKFTVIRREQQLEKLAIDGQLTATLAVEGLRIGDVLRLVASTTNREPALKGNLQASAALPFAPFKVGFARARFLWPATTPVHWRTYATGAATAETTRSGITELVVTGPLPKPAELPDDVPIRYRPLQFVEVATFADWNAVSRTMAPLYATAGTIVPGSDLAKEVAAIAASTTDPLKRTAAALELVQEKVRYLYNGMENGNYVPQTPASTWALRYGDCKAKTLLLLAVLDELKIDAEPVLASSQLGDYVPKRLPSAGAFDHVLVHATVAGKSLWLDGTATGTRLADLEDIPPFRWVLPLRTAGATLVDLPMRAPTTPGSVIVLELDQRGGLGLPTLVHVVATVRGPIAEMVGLARSQGSKEQKDQMVSGIAGAIVGRDGLALSEYSLSYDPVAATAVVDARGIVTTLWQLNDRRYRMDLDRTISSVNFAPDRSRPAWRDLPVNLGAPQTTRMTTRVLLPRDVTGFTFDGDTSVAQPLAGLTVTRQTTLKDGMVVVDDLAASSGGEVAAKDVPAMRTRVAAAKTRLLRAVAPETVPTRWANIQAARRDGRFKPIVDTYARAIAATPDEASGYVNRANFYAGIFDWKAALPDLDKAVALDGSAGNLLGRATAYQMLGEEAKATADMKAALQIDPMNAWAIEELGKYDIDHGRRGDAVARIDEQIDAGGENKSGMLLIKSDLLEYAGDKDGAAAAMDQALAAKPGNPGLLNGRCWLRGRLNTALDGALKDCTKSIELSDYPAAPLDSRALIYFRLNRFDDALTDLNAALDAYPNQAGSLWLRGIVLTRQGKAVAARDDLAAARFMNPLIEKEYRRFGVAP